MRVFRGLGRVARLRPRPGLYWSTVLGVALVYATTEEVTATRRWRPAYEDVVFVGETDLPATGVVVVGHDIEVVDVVRVPSSGGAGARRERLLRELRTRGHV